MKCQGQQGNLHGHSPHEGQVVGNASRCWQCRHVLAHMPTSMLSVHPELIPKIVYILLLHTVLLSVTDFSGKLHTALL